MSEGTAVPPSRQIYQRFTSQPTVSLDKEYKEAVMADDAAAPVDLWNDRVWGLVWYNTVSRQKFLSRFKGCCPLDSIWSGLLCFWRQRVLHSLLGYLTNEKHLWI